MGIGNRLREERERLGFNQTDLATLGGASKNSQYNYEKGDRHPDTAYLAAVAEHGVDVLYVITGQRQPIAGDSLSAEEAELLTAYRTVNDEDRQVLTRIAHVFAKAAANP